MKSLTLAAVLILALGASTNAIAQHDATHDQMVAKGWTWVADFEPGFYAIEYGDTIFTTGPVRLLSVNGGKTFDTIPYPDAAISDGIGWRYRAQFDPRRALITLYPNPDSTIDSVAISTDLGRTYRYFPRPKGWVPDPKDSSVLLFDSVFVQGTYVNSTLYRSTDSGLSWYQVSGCANCPLPGAPSGYNGLNFQFLYDVRQNGMWYVIFEDPTGNWQGPMYRTADNGMSFTYCALLSNPVTLLAGIGEPGELRDPWPGPYDARGYETFDTGAARRVDWVDSLLPGRPDTLGHYNFFGMMYRLVYDDNAIASLTSYSFSWNNPNYLLMAVRQEMQTPWLHQAFPDSIWWFYSKDGGKNWTDVWSIDSDSRAIVIDRAHPDILWASDDRSLYRKDMNQTSSVVTTESGRLPSLRIVKSGSLIDIESPDGTGCLEVYNILGQRIFRTTTEVGVVRVNLSKFPGVFFIAALDRTGRVLARSSVAIE